MNDRRKFIKTYEQTVSLNYLQKRFKHWDDIKDNTLWKQSVQLYLSKLRFNILKAIYQKQLSRFPYNANSGCNTSTNSSQIDPAQLIQKIYQQNQFIQQQRIHVLKKNEIIKQQNISLTLKSNHITALQLVNKQHQDKIHRLQNANVQLLNQIQSLSIKNEKNKTQKRSKSIKLNRKKQQIIRLQNAPLISVRKTILNASKSIQNQKKK
eukprot:351981_1